jgi:hypothetical protein
MSASAARCLNHRIRSKSLPLAGLRAPSRFGRCSTQSIDRSKNMPIGAMEARYLLAIVLGGERNGAGPNQPGRCLPFRLAIDRNELLGTQVPRSCE